MNISGTGADLIETFCCRFQTTMDKHHGVIGIGLGHRLYIKNGLSHSDDAYCFLDCHLEAFVGAFCQSSHVCLMFSSCY